MYPRLAEEAATEVGSGSGLAFVGTTGGPFGRGLAGDPILDIAAASAAWQAFAVPKVSLSNFFPSALALDLAGESVDVLRESGVCEAGRIDQACS